MHWIYAGIFKLQYVNSELSYACYAELRASSGSGQLVKVLSTSYHDY
jgi:hypothetical protein